MAGAVAVTLVGFRFFRSKIAVDRTGIDAPLVIGAVLFGAGWGIAGYCPGPAVTALSNPTAEAAVFVAAMVVGGICAKIPFSKGAGRLAQR